MANEDYTVLILSQQSSEIKKLRLPPFTLKMAAALGGILTFLGAFIIYDYTANKQELGDPTRLRAEIHARNLAIRAFGEKVALLEERLTHLKNMEKQTKLALYEVDELKKLRKDSQLVRRNGNSLGTKDALQEAACFREEQICFFESERPPLLSRLQHDLLVLRKEAFRAEQHLKGLQQFLQSKKAILLSTPFLWPVWGRISSKFGDTRLSAYSGGTRPHKGVDIAAPLGTPIVAPSDGVVSFVGQELDVGRLIFIDHGHGFTTMYGHLNKAFVHRGDKVRKGQTIGAVGASGKCTGPHLHYEVRLQGKQVNPGFYLNQAP
ncbi:MAG: M23 family metallopeptidase [Thermodesulfobacteriota bacterium]